ncbi:ABC transporter ATP-binding protein [Pedococcus sp.]|uniref:ABC transporter ATP-binding protein n=1 Tax=Pedococcus sp. TaxID=2860345 RepID=UPI002E10F83C|nr:ATP-binding cassette domain-containing protein [Pedococcus sp.]
MIEFQDVSVAYAVGTQGADVQPQRVAFTGATFTVPEGELVLVVGPTGAGKSTLLRCINGLVPHFSGGTLRGRVVVDGRDTRVHRPRDLADLVGFVAQDPVSSFVTDTVEEEVAYGMEAMGVDATAMRRRVEETLDLMGLSDVRHRALKDLSGGQQQRVAIGAVLAAGPRILVLDEPTSALDPVAAEDVLATLHRLVHDLGITVVVAEHRLERVIHHADRVLLLESGRVSGLLDPADAMVHSPVFPPVIALGRALEWRPLPLSVRDARRRARELRGSLTPPAPSPSPSLSPSPSPSSRTDAQRPPVTRLERLTVRRGPVVALREVDLSVRPTEVVALMGRNGAGKSTLLACIAGQLQPSGGRVRLGDLDPARSAPAQIVRRAGLVPQDPSLILYADTVADELATADRDFGLPAGSTAAVLDRVARGVARDQHPRDLSEGQRVSLALAVVLASMPPLVLLDEPTRGLDYAAKRRLVQVLAGLAAQGRAVVLATHDVELAAEVATRVVILAEGEVVADGPATDVLAGSPAFAPQVAKILHPLPFLTVDDVVAALGQAS